MRPLLPIALLALVAGCTAPIPQLAGGPAARIGVAFLPDAQGLGIEGSAQRIDFGRSPKGVIPVMERELGPGRVLGLETCEAGIVTQEAWGDLVLSFTAERFVGWRGPQGAAGQTCA